MTPIRAGLGLAALLLSACQPAGGLHPLQAAADASAKAEMTQPATDGLVAGRLFMATGEYSRALAAYMRALTQHGATAEVLSAIGSANLKLGRFPQAERLLREATGKDPSFVPAWNNLGVVLMNEGKFNEARRVFKIAFGLDRGQSQLIRKNLQLAIAKSSKLSYNVPNKNKLSLVRRGDGRYLLIETPTPEAEQ